MSQSASRSPEDAARIMERYWTLRNRVFPDLSKKVRRTLPRFTCVIVLQENYRCIPIGTGSMAWVPVTDHLVVQNEK